MHGSSVFAARTFVLSKSTSVQKGLKTIHGCMDLNNLQVPCSVHLTQRNEPGRRITGKLDLTVKVDQNWTTVSVHISSHGSLSVADSTVSQIPQHINVLPHAIKQYENNNVESVASFGKVGSTRNIDPNTLFG